MDTARPGEIREQILDLMQEAEPTLELRAPEGAPQSALWHMVDEIAGEIAALEAAALATVC